MNRSILNAVFIFLIVCNYFNSGCSCDSVKGGFVIITQFLPDGEVGKPYFALLEARDGVEPFVWSIESGVLPDGLTLNPASGEISGVPQKDGSSDFVVKVTDANWNTATKGFTIKIFLPSQVNVTLRVNNGDGVPFDTYVALGVDSLADIKTTGNAGTGVYSYTFTGSDVNTAKFLTVACTNLNQVELKTVAIRQNIFLVC